MRGPMRRLLSFFLVLQFVLPFPVFAAAVGEFASVIGDVRQTRAGETLRPVVKSPIEMKDVIITGSDASATMVFSDESSIALAPGSRLEIREYLFKGQSRKASFFLGIGKLTADVKKYIGGGNVFEVHSPTAVAGVRGTGFEVVVALVGTQMTTTVTCTTGALTLSALSATGAVVATSTIVAGQTAVISVGGITVSAASAAAAGAGATVTTGTGVGTVTTGAAAGTAGTAGAAAGAATVAGVGAGTIAAGVAATALITTVVIQSTGGGASTTTHHSTQTNQ